MHVVPSFHAGRAHILLCFLLVFERLDQSQVQFRFIGALLFFFDVHFCEGVGEMAGRGGTAFFKLPDFITFGCLHSQFFQGYLYCPQNTGNSMDRNKYLKFCIYPADSMFSTEYRLGTPTSEKLGASTHTEEVWPNISPTVSLLGQ